MNKFNVGNYVKWNTMPKRGVVYHGSGVIVSIGNSVNDILYSILKKDGGKIDLHESELIRDIKVERDIQINKLLNNNYVDGGK